jgi:hypothetical protein
MRFTLLICRPNLCQQGIQDSLKSPLCSLRADDLASPCRKCDRIVRADEMIATFLELESPIRKNSVDTLRRGWSDLHPRKVRWASSQKLHPDPPSARINRDQVACMIVNANHGVM